MNCRDCQNEVDGRCQLTGEKVCDQDGCNVGKSEWIRKKDILKVLHREIRRGVGYTDRAWNHAIYVVMKSVLEMKGENHESS